MKKFLLPILACFLLFTSCTEKARIVTSYYTVHNDQWRQSNNPAIDGNYFYSVWENIDITPDVIERGVVMVYYIDADGRDNILPFTQYLIGTDGSGNTVYYQERLEYDIEVGKITFKIKDSDFSTDISMQNIGEMKFKVCVIYNS